MMSTGGFADPNAGATPGGPQQAQAYQDEGSQAKNAASAPPLSRQRGKNWAVPENAQRPGPTVVRQIAVKAYPAHYELRTSKGQVLTFPIDPRKPELSVLQLATAAREQISSWGPSISGGRWQPQLSVQVQPRAEGAYAALANLLEGSGLEVQRSGAR